MVVVSVICCCLSLVMLMGMFYSSPMSYLVMLEYMYLMVSVYLMLSHLSSSMGWVFMVLLFFSACESVYVLVSNMVGSKFIGMIKVYKYHSWGCVFSLMENTLLLSVWSP